MKKRIITLLAILALLVTCAVFAVQADAPAPAAPGIHLDGTETCPVAGCGLALNAITDWNEEGSHHVWIGADVTLTESPAWGTADQTILIRSSKDFSEAATAVKITADGNFRLATAVAKKLTIYGDLATIESDMYYSEDSKGAVNGTGGMFTTANGGTLKVYGDITLKRSADAATVWKGGALQTNKGTANFTGVTFDGITSSGWGGAVFQTNGGSNSFFTDCLFKNCTSASGGAAYIEGGADSGFTDCVFYQCEATSLGGAIYQTTYSWGTAVGSTANGNSNAKKQYHAMDVDGCTFTECSAGSNGGLVYVDSGTFNLKNSTVTGCTAAKGGAIYSNAYGFTYKDSADATTTSTKYYYAIVNVTSTNISKCESTGAGGAIYNNNGTSSTNSVTVTDSNITDCVAGGNAGAIYTVKGKCIVKGTSEISGCYAGANGGSVYVGSGQFELQGTAKLKATAKGYQHSRGVRIQGGWMRVRDNAQIISTGDGFGSGINAITTSESGTTTVYIILQGNAKVIGPNGEHEGNILLTKHQGPGWTDKTKYKYSQLWIYEGWSGEASVAYSFTSTGYATSYYEQIHGSTQVNEGTAGVVDNNFAFVKTYADSAWVNSTKSDSFTGKLYAENTSGTPLIKGEAHQLRVCSTAIRDHENAKFEWYTSNADAITAAEGKEKHSVRLYTDDPLVIPEGSVSYIDFYGRVPESITNNGTLYAFDGSTYSSKGEKGVTIPVETAEKITFAPNGVTYLVKRNGDGTSTIFPIVIKNAAVTGATLRPGVAGIYFNGTFEIVAHEEIKNEIMTGVAVSLGDIGTSLQNTAWTAVGGATNANGILVQNIMTEKDDNSGTEIKAEACVTFDNELVFLSDDNRGISLTGLLTQMNTKLGDGTMEALNDEQQAAMNAFCKKWNDIYNNLWAELTNLVK